MPDEPYMAGYSRKAVRRAGKHLRDWYRGDIPDPAEGSDEEERLHRAIHLMITFRESFQRPLNKTAMGLRSMVATELGIDRRGVSLPVVQRLKRQVQIVGKLARFPAMDLTAMGDIGGCRVLLQDDARVDGLLNRIENRWGIKEVRDTRQSPAGSGYRAVHVIVERERRRIEIQLRTPKQHEWAVAVERTGQRLAMPLKEGFGPADLLEYFRLAGHGLYLEEYGITPSPEFTAAFNASREQVGEYFRR